MKELLKIKIPKKTVKVLHHNAGYVARGVWRTVADENGGTEGRSSVDGGG